MHKIEYPLLFYITPAKLDVAIWRWVASLANYNFTEVEDLM